jgi:hypothetical protein
MQPPAPPTKKKQQEGPSGKPQNLIQPCQFFKYFTEII